MNSTGLNSQSCASPPHLWKRDLDKKIGHISSNHSSQTVIFVKCLNVSFGSTFLLPKYQYHPITLRPNPVTLRSPRIRRCTSAGGRASPCRALKLRSFSTSMLNRSRCSWSSATARRRTLALATGFLKKMGKNFGKWLFKDYSPVGICVYVKLFSCHEIAMNSTS